MIMATEKISQTIDPRETEVIELTKAEYDRLVTTISQLRKENAEIKKALDETTERVSDLKQTFSEIKETVAKLTEDEHVVFFENDDD